MVATHDTPTTAVESGDAFAWLNRYIANLPETHSRMVQSAWRLACAHYPAKAATLAGEPLRDNLLASAQVVADMDLLPDAVAATLLVDIPNYLPGWKTEVAECCGSAVAPSRP